jgi:hypothetical protein
MRSILLCAAALTLAACNPPAPPAEEAPTAADASTDASAMAPAPAAGSAAPAAAAAPTGGPAADAMAPPPVDNGMAGSPTSQTTRDMAKEKAEETNLHPRTP